MTLAPLSLGGSVLEGWSQLRSLNMADNDLSELPADLAQLDELMMLDFTRNDQITSIPNELGLLKNLFSFKIDGLTRKVVFLNFLINTVVSSQYIPIVDIYNNYENNYIDFKSLKNWSPLKVKMWGRYLIFTWIFVIKN